MTQFTPRFSQFQPGLITGYERQPAPSLAEFVKHDLPGLLEFVRGREDVRQNRRDGVEHELGGEA